MEEIKNKSDLEIWLDSKRLEFACILATRAALRVAPLLIEALHDDKEEWRATIVFPSFCALAAASLGATWPARAVEIRDSARSFAHKASDAIEAVCNDKQLALVEYMEIRAELPFGFIQDCEANLRSLRLVESVVGAAAHATQSVVDAVDTAHGLVGPHSIVEAAIATYSDACSAVDSVHGYADLYSALEENSANKVEVAAHIAEFWKAAEQDAKFLETWGEEEDVWADAVKSLSEKVLWIDQIPTWVGRKWADFRDKLPDDEGWWVWIDWYEARLQGRSLGETLELGRIKILEHDWQQGPAYTNTIIAKLLELKADPIVLAISQGFEELDAVQQATSIDLSLYVDRIRNALPNDPYQAIGASKEMLEAAMKTILSNRGREIADNITFQKLTDSCISELGLAENSPPATESEKHLRTITSSARKMIKAINELRGCAGTGHGRVVGSEPMVTAPDVSLVVSVGLILTTWLLRQAENEYAQG